MRLCCSEEALLQRLFPAFPGGLPGFALLLLRGVLAIALLVQGTCYLREPGAPANASITGILAIVVSGLLLVGVLTPFAGILAGLFGVAVRFSLLPSCSRNVVESNISAIFAAAILLGVISLGPGAFSIDARIFGRREIIIPPRPCPPG